MSATDEGGQVDAHAIRARVDAATEGPWSYGAHGVIRETPGQLSFRHVAEYAEGPDAEFIAHARTDIPKLLDEVERLAALAQRRTWERDGAEAILEVESRVRGDVLAADLATEASLDRSDAVAAVQAALNDPWANPFFSGWVCTHEFDTGVCGVCFDNISVVMAKAARIATQALSR